MGRDHACEGCGNGGFANDLPCECGDRIDVLTSVVNREWGRGVLTSASLRELERVKAERDYFHTVSETQMEVRDEAQAELERVKAERDRYREAISDLQAFRGDLAEDIKDAKREGKRAQAWAWEESLACVDGILARADEEVADD